MISGVILLNKRVGNTSRKEVSLLARRLNEKKAGHIGTLDPFASGLLIVLLGKATKISPFLEGFDKEYVATLKLGTKTDSADLTGNIIEKRDVLALSTKQIEEVLSSFLGEQYQIPPMYSAIKRNGVPLYKYAREGENIERNPRPINIKKISLLSYKDDEITFSCLVSKGTYIRTLGEDIADKLGTVGHLASLKRTRVGGFSLNEAKTIDKIDVSDLISIEKALSPIKVITIDEKQHFKALNGAKLRLDDFDDEIIIVVDENGIIAIYQKDDDGLYSCLRGFR